MPERIPRVETKGQSCSAGDTLQSGLVGTISPARQKCKGRIAYRSENTRVMLPEAQVVFDDTAVHSRRAGRLIRLTGGYG